MMSSLSEATERQVPRLRVAGLTRRFGDVVANDGLGLTVGAGEIVGLLGENGAGKSTLLAILAGMTTPDAGEIRVDGDVVALRSPADAIRAGVGTVFQHFALVPVFTVREQLRLSGGRIDPADTLLGDLDPGQCVADLSVGERQRLEIARVLARQPRLLLLDEPTSTLTGAQVERLFVDVRRLRDRGTGIVFVTHKLPEALAIADRLVVMRRGAIVDEVRRDDSRAGGRAWEVGVEERLLTAMFGGVRTAAAAEIAGVAPVKPKPSGTAHLGVAVVGADSKPLLSVREASASTGYGRHRPRDVSFEVRAGAMLAIIGIDGQGQRELAEFLVGHLTGTGSVRLDDRELAGSSAAERQGLGLSYLTDDRTGEGGVADLSVSLNLLLKRQRRPASQRLGVLRAGAIREQGRRLIDRWGISPPTPSVAMGTLSGGNMQKVLLAREMELAPRLLVAGNPTHGLDLRTQELVWDALGRVTGRGGAVVLFTPDLDEAIARADEIAVLAEGRLSPATRAIDTDRASVSRMMVSGW